MRVLVAVPWRPQPHRVYAHDLVTDAYRRILPDAHQVDVDTAHDPFCLAACRNRAVRLAEDHGAQVVVIGDADTVPEAAPLLDAIDAAHTSGLVHLPYTRYRSLRANGTRQHLTGVPLGDCDHVTVPFACSGVYVTTPAAWWAAGGQDEHFRGWAPEDMAFAIAHRVLRGADLVRHDGRVFALHHESPPKHGPAYDAAVARYQRYLTAGDAGDVDTIRVLVTESHGQRVG